MKLNNVICLYCDNIVCNSLCYKLKVYGLPSYIVCTKCIKKVIKHVHLKDKNILLDQYIFFVKDQKNNIIFVDKFEELHKFKNVMYGAYLNADELQNPSRLNVFYNFDQIESLENDGKHVFVVWKNGKSEYFNRNKAMMVKIKKFAKKNDCENQPFLFASDEDDTLLSSDLAKIYITIQQPIKKSHKHPNYHWFKSIEHLSTFLNISLSNIEQWKNFTLVMDTFLYNYHFNKLQKTIHNLSSTLQKLQTLYFK